MIKLIVVCVASILIHVILLLTWKDNARSGNSAGGLVTPQPEATLPVSAGIPTEGTPAKVAKKVPIGNAAPTSLAHLAEVEALPERSDPQKILGAGLGPSTPVAFPQDPLWYKETMIFAAIANSGGTDKANHHQYHPLYAKVLAPFREAVPKSFLAEVAGNGGLDLDGSAGAKVEKTYSMMEIGLGCTMGGKWGPAGGYHVFRQYLPNTRYYSFEYDFKLCLKRWAKTGKHSPVIHRAREYLKDNVNIGDQGKVADLNRAIAKFGVVDIIADDGSHQPGHQLTSFRHLFLHMLKPGGVYVIEDLQSNYGVKWSVMFGLSKEIHEKRLTMVAYLRDLMMAMQYHYWDPTNYDHKVSDSPFRLDEAVVSWVEDVTCVQQACAVTKRLTPFKRFDE